MTAQDLLKLPPDELSHISAERVMGWTVVKADQPPFYPFADEWSKNKLPMRVCEHWRPSTDRNDAAMLLERIGELGLQRKFMRFLHGIIVGALNPNDPWPIDWMYVTATPKQITVASIAAKGE